MNSYYLYNTRLAVKAMRGKSETIITDLFTTFYYSTKHRQRYVYEGVDKYHS